LLVLLDQDEVGGRLDGHQAGLRAVEVLVGDQGDQPGEHLAGQQAALLPGEGGQESLQAQAEGVQGAVGGGDEAVQPGQAEELAQQAQAAGALEVEGQEQGQDEPALEAFAGGTAEEGNEFGVGAGGVVAAEPVAQGGARDAVAAGVLPLGEALGLGEVVAGAAGVGALTAGAWARGGLVGRVRGSHGSCPRSVVAKPP
jgi:hypothetical protein